MSVEWNGLDTPPVGAMVTIDRMGFYLLPDSDHFIGIPVKVLANYKAGDVDMIVVESPGAALNFCFRACMARVVIEQEFKEVMRLHRITPKLMRTPYSQGLAYCLEVKL